MKDKGKKDRIAYACFLVLRRIVKLVYPRIAVEGAEHLGGEATIIVGNHSQMNGPICGEIYSPVDSATWCAWQMMKLKEMPAYAYNDFWSGKPARVRWLYRIFSYLIAPVSMLVFNNARTIPVYHDKRLMSTFRQTADALSRGVSVIIFPESYDAHNNIINAFHEGFVDVARVYHRRTGRAIAFTPLYIAPELKKMVFGKPVYFDPDAPIADERQRICAYLMDAITDMAVSLPRHTVVPYANVARSEYKTNK